MQGFFISVVIPTYNSASFVAKTLETVFLQTYNNYEVIISDDGSTKNNHELDCFSIICSIFRVGGRRR